MGSDTGFKILFSTNLASEKVKINYRRINRLAECSEINERIKREWPKLLLESKKAGRKCFDSPGYSVDRIHFDNIQATLFLSDTTYCQYVTTFKNHELLRSIPIQVQPKLLSVFGVVMSKNGYLIFGLGSPAGRGGEYVCAVGGTVQSTMPPVTSTYLFTEFQREITEETGIPRADISQICLRGAVIKENTAETPRLIFSAVTNLNIREIEDYFPKSDKEFQRLIFVKNNLKEIENIANNPDSNWTIEAIRRVCFKT